MTKVKGHATDREVLRGEVDIEHKKGNDEADDVAERGITDEQTMLGTLAEIYDKRQQEVHQVHGKGTVVHHQAQRGG